MTKAQAGSLGGKRTFELYGRDWMRKIGYKGGQAYVVKYIAHPRGGAAPSR